MERRLFELTYNDNAFHCGLILVDGQKLGEVVHNPVTETWRVSYCSIQGDSLIRACDSPDHGLDLAKDFQDKLDAEVVVQEG